MLHPNSTTLSRVGLAFVLSLFAPAALLASPNALAAPPADKRANGRTPQQDQEDKKAMVLAAIELPTKAKALRDQGVPPDQVKKALKAVKAKNVHAKEATEMLDEAAKAVEENGPVDNFGAFVQSQLDAGKRGRELAIAIKAEHQARGKKSKGKGKGKGLDKAEAGAPSDEAETGGGMDGDTGGVDGKGRPEDAGQSDGKGKADDAAQPDVKGKPEGAEDKGKPEAKKGKGHPEGQKAGKGDKGKPGK